MSAWITGPVKCRICSRMYIAVVTLPPGLEDLECPDCGNMSVDGVDEEPELPQGDPA